MQSKILFAIVIIANCSIPTWSNAQNLYRCGNTYSQTPCDNGKAIDVTDSRTAAQQKQAAAANSNRMAQAGALEKERLAREKRVLTTKKGPAAVIAPAAGPSGVPAPTDKALAKKRKKAAAEFAGKAPAAKKVKKPSKAKNTTDGKA